MIAKVKGKDVMIYKSNGVIVRQIHCYTNVDSAYVSGDEVNVQLCNGHCEIYALDGRRIRSL